MQIRAQQIKHFENEGIKECEIFTRNFIEEQDPELVRALPRDVYERRVRLGIERAKTYDIGEFGDVAAFVYFMFKVGADFDEYPPFQELLTDPATDGDDKMMVLTELATDQQWAEAQLGCEANAWELLEGQA